ncbi:hypothetical protein A2U01_0096802, partial [Trifolium medium]|nr:hypothetical protein [Trifolium medium]
RGAAVKQFPAYQDKQDKKSTSPHGWRKLTYTTTSCNLTGYDDRNQAPSNKDGGRRE